MANLTPLRTTVCSCLLALVALGGLGGCSTATDATGTPDAFPIIAVEPQDFPGDRACGTAHGFATYTARLLDVSDDGTGRTGLAYPLAVRAAPLTSCDLSLAFGDVVPGNAYVVDVDGYADEDGDPKTLDHCVNEGTVTRRTGGKCTHEVLAPRWRWRCFGALSSLDVGAAGAAGTGGAPQGDAPSGLAAIAFDYRVTPLHACLPR